MKEKVKKIIIPAVAGALLILGIVFDKKEESPPRFEAEPETFSNDIIVEIKGEVKYPGIYQIFGDARIYDLVVLAGGLTADADTASLNMADFLRDGAAVFVPSKKEVQTDKISLNHASLEELMTLKGIGETKAKSIIEYREQHGGFKSIDEVKNVKGISENLFEQLKEFLSL